MEPLFRLVVTRSAVEHDDDTARIPLRQDSPLQQALAAAREAGASRDEVKAIAQGHVDSPAFVGDPRSLAIHSELRALASALDLLERQASVENVDVVSAVEATFGKRPSELVSAGVPGEALTLLRDSVVVVKLLPTEHRRRLEALVDQLRLLELIVKVATDPTFPGSGTALRRYRRRPLVLPDELRVGPVLSRKTHQQAQEKARKEAEAARRATADAQLGVYRRLRGAIAEITALGPEHLNTGPQKVDGGFMVPTDFQATELAMKDVAREQTRPVKAALRTSAVEAVADRGATAMTFARRFLIGRGPVTPVAPMATAFRLTPSAESAVSPETHAILKERGLSLVATPLDRLVETLRLETLKLSEQLDDLLGRPVQRTLRRVGKSVVVVATPLATVWNEIVLSWDAGTSKPFPDPLPVDSIPQSHGSLAPAGVADLLVVRQQLVRYEGADVAHIENILRGERKEREHSRRLETEEISIRETETTTTEEREHESTTRFEMSRETSQTLREDATLRAGLTLSGKYGPTVEFTATADGSVSRSKEEATRAAATFSQDVTDRSASRLTERILERTSLRVTNEVIEKNRHAFDNTNGGGHIAGVYQWVNKVYQAQMFNYGIRMMYDFMVAEPAAFLISALEGAHASATRLEKPVEFTLRPDQLTESNYHGWVKAYGATDVQAPPELYKTKSQDWNAEGGDDDADYSHSALIAIDEGYKAVFGSVGIIGNVWQRDASIDVVLGRRAHRFADGPGYDVWATGLDDETDTIPVAIGSWKYSQVAAAIEVKCQRTERAMVKWRLETHARLTTAYKARLSEYQEQLKALEVQAGVAVRGRNPFLNLELMNDELKKHCISILTEQHFDLFGAVRVGSHDVPQLDLIENAAEGPYVRFFEQAFEWEHMTWLSYPYFWGRKSQWAQRIAYDDADPTFNQFLKAGYCRVAVPVRPGFEGAVDHFMTYGEIWSGGPLPTISSPLYVPIAEEIAERLDRPGDEVPEGAPWLVRIPTTLVRLRSDDQLPRWHRNQDGDWVED